jgi:hypothetical protein
MKRDSESSIIKAYKVHRLNNSTTCYRVGRLVHFWSEGQGKSQNNTQEITTKKSSEWVLAGFENRPYNISGRTMKGWKESVSNIRNRSHKVVLTPERITTAYSPLRSQNLVSRDYFIIPTPKDHFWKKTHSSSDIKNQYRIQFKR